MDMYLDDLSKTEVRGMGAFQVDAHGGVPLTLRSVTEYLELLSSIAKFSSPASFR
jgi:hypothetical protein